MITKLSKHANGINILNAVLRVLWRKAIMPKSAPKPPMTKAQNISVASFVRHVFSLALPLSIPKRAKVMIFHIDNMMRNTIICNPPKRLLNKKCANRGVGAKKGVEIG